MTPAALVALILGSTAAVVAWSVSTPFRRDELARDFAREVLLVDGLAEAGGIERIRALRPYLVRSTRAGAHKLVLAQDAMSAAALVATEDGDEVAVSHLLGAHRVLPTRHGQWAVALLPAWLAFLGERSEHGGERR